MVSPCLCSYYSLPNSARSLNLRLETEVTPERSDLPSGI